MNFNFRVIPEDLKNKRVLLRVDFNIPLEKREAGEDLRVLKTLPTINLLRRRGAKVLLISHLEKGGKRMSIRPVFIKIRKEIRGLRFVGGLIGRKVERAVGNLKAGDVLMLENLRISPGEKKNSPVFAKKLASLADLYVNEAFSVSHRRHASIVGLPKYLPSYAGPLFKEEIKNLSLAFSPPRPFTLVVGGNKLKTKIPLIKKFLKKADRVVIGGALAESFLNGENKRLGSAKIVLPKDVITKRHGRSVAVDASRLGSKDIIYDLGPKSMKEISGVARKNRFILWNGPLGWIEGGYVSGTLKLAKTLRLSKAKVVAGGGDTAAFLRAHRLAGGFHFISTAGGAMLEFLVRGTLPGIAALEKGESRQRREALRK